MTGWRVGYLACPEEIYRQAAKVHSHTVTCATSFAQHGAIAALGRSDSASEAMRNEFDRRRTKVVEKLRTEGIDVSKPPGAFYLFLATEARNDVELCERLLKEHHVAVTPGSAFGMEGYIRVAYTTAPERLIAGIDRIKHVLA